MKKVNRIWNSVIPKINWIFLFIGTAVTFFLHGTWLIRLPTVGYKETFVQSESVTFLLGFAWPILIAISIGLWFLLSIFLSIENTFLKTEFQNSTTWLDYLILMIVLIRNFIILLFMLFPLSILAWPPMSASPLLSLIPLKIFHPYSLILFVGMYILVMIWRGTVSQRLE